MSDRLRKELQKESKAFFRNLLQVDANGSSQSSLTQDLASFADRDSKFQWRLMVLSMKQIRMLMLFFHSQAKSQFKGIKNLLDKIEYYNENEHILEEEVMSD